MKQIKVAKLLKMSKFCVYIILTFDIMKGALLKIEFLIIKLESFASKIVDHVAPN